MDHNNYEWMIHQVVSSMLPTWHDKRICLVMKLDMKWSFWPEESDKDRSECNYRKEYMLAFYRTDNYTKVFLRDITDDRELFSNTLDKGGFKLFKLTCDHDSCWTSDGLNFIWKAFVNAWDYFDTKKVNGRGIDPMIHYSLFQGSPHYREIELEKPKDRDDYHTQPWKVRFGRKIEMHEISTYMRRTHRGEL